MLHWYTTNKEWNHRPGLMTAIWVNAWAGNICYTVWCWCFLDSIHSLYTYIYIYNWLVVSTLWNISVNQPTIPNIREYKNCWKYTNKIEVNYKSYDHKPYLLPIIAAIWEPEIGKRDQLTTWLQPARNQDYRFRIWGSLNRPRPWSHKFFDLAHNFCDFAVPLPVGFWCGSDRKWAYPRNRWPNFPEPLRRRTTDCPHPIQNRHDIEQFGIRLQCCVKIKQMTIGCNPKPRTQRFSKENTHDAWFETANIFLWHYDPLPMWIAMITKVPCSLPSSVKRVPTTLAKCCQNILYLAT